MTNLITARLEPLPPLGELAETWRALERTAAPSFFQSWHWIGSWLAESGLQPRLLVARRGAAVVGLGLVQAAVQRRAGLPVRGLYLNQAGDRSLDCVTMEFNGMLAAPGDRAAVHDACIGALFSRDGSGGGDRFDALYLSGVPAHCLARLRDRGLAARLKIRRGSPLVALDRVRAGGGAYEAGLSRNTRQQIRRARRLYEEAGPLRLERAAGVDEALAHFDRLKALHQQTWVGRGRPGAFAEPFFERFHRRLIRAAFADGGVDLLHIAAGGRTVGYLYNLVRDGQVYAYQSGFAYDADARLKPGLVSHALAVEHYLAGDFSAYHFMAGADRYKLSLSNDSLDLDWIVVWRGRLIGLADRLLLAYRRLLRAPGGPGPGHD